MKKDMKAGIGITTVIVAVIILIFVWRIGSKESSYLLNIEFDDIGNLQNGDAVIIQGVKAGKVQKISLQSSDIVVSIQLPKSVLIPKGSDFQISNIGLMGERAIQIIRSNEDEYHEVNDTIQGHAKQQISIGEGIGKLASNIGSSISISQKLDSIIVLLNKQMELLAKDKGK